MEIFSIGNAVWRDFEMRAGHEQFEEDDMTWECYTGLSING